MKRILFYLIIIFAGILISSFLIKPQDDKDYSKEWKQVDSLVNQGLPRSAIQLVDNIFNEAKAQNNQPQYLKALIYRASLQGQFEEDHLVKAINLFENELSTAQGAEKQIIQSLLAELYHRFYVQNQWLINSRTSLENPENEDIRTWDAVKLNKTIAGLYLASISNQKVLEEIPLANFSPVLLNTEKSGFVLWPSLFDLLANRALDYFSSNDAGLAEIGGILDIPAKQLFSPAKQFISLTIPSRDTMFYNARAISIYQYLLAFHETSGKPSSLLDLDLKRLDFVRNLVVSDEVNDSLYTAALENLFNNYQDDSMFVRIAFRLASQYQSLGSRYAPLQGDENRWWLNKAEETCEKAIQLYPDKGETAACRNLLNSIREKQFTFQINAASLPEKPILTSLNFRNTTKVFFRIVKVDPKEDYEKRVNQNETDVIKSYLKLSAFKEYAQELPDTKDHQTHSTEIMLPALPTGYYVVFASNDANFKTESEIEYNSIWVTRLSYITKNNRQTGSLEIFVFDREDGNTIPEVKITAYERKYDSRVRNYVINKLGNYETNMEGFASIDNLTDQNRNSVAFVLEKGNDMLNSSNYFNVYRSNTSNRTITQTYIFTDRAIYRPGQTVYFKGIVVDKTGDEVAIKPDYISSVSLYDANRKEIASLEVRTNSFGSFQGAFVIPRGGLNGEFRIKNQTGTARFQVEEYKRPTFKVSFDTLAGQYKLGDAVSVSGKAMNFTGSPLGKAQVKYRVVRAEIIVPYFRFYRPFPKAREMEIAYGNTNTQADGTFNIEFVAKDDELKTGEIPYNFFVYVDVTDLTGEVQSAQTNIMVGKDALILSLDVPEKLQKGGGEQINLLASNLSGAPVDIQAQVLVYQLTPPTRLLNRKYWSRPDINLISKEEYILNFPHEAYGNELDKATWPRKKFSETAVETKKGKINLYSNLTANAPGEYLVVASALTQAGDTVKVERYFTLYSFEAKQTPGNEVCWSTISKSKAEPGESIQLLLGSSAKKSRFLIEVVNGEEVVDQSWVNLSAGQKVVSIPVKEAYRGNFAVNVQMVRFNRYYSDSYTIEVPFTNKKLDISLETHRDFLTPGQKEEWRVKISGPGGETLAAELMAGMYDASLDQFISHSWQLDLYRSKSNNMGWNSAFFMAPSSQGLFRIPVDYVNIGTLMYPQLNWFGYEGFYGGGPRDYAVMSSAKVGGMRNGEVALDEAAMEDSSEAPVINQGDEGTPPPAETEMEEITNPLRTNFNETAFFYPQLKTDSLGSIIFTFTTPDALTEWKLMMLATSKDLKIGQLVQNFKSKKDLMIMPNVPRFVRQGDMLQFSAKVINFTEEAINAEANIEFYDALTMEPVNIFYNNQKPAKNIAVDAMGSAEVNWQISVPFDLNMLGYRITAKTGAFSDGEERIFPVLTNRMLVTETLPMYVNANQTKTYTLKKLADSDKIMMMSTLQNYRFTLEYTSNPAWYAVQALPYLNEPAFENASALFQKYYVNVLSAHIANSNPKIKNVFSAWQNLTPDAFYSKLQNNQELKNTVLNATPWVLEAEDETEQKRRIGILFDVTRMASEQETALNKLVENQLPGGAWPWFKGMKEDRHTTQNIVLGLAKLNNKGVLDLKSNSPLSVMTKKAVAYLDAMIREDYDKLKKDNSQKELNKRVPGSLQIEYLYMRSLLMNQYPLADENRDAFDYFQSQAKKYWLKQDIYMQVMTSFALYRLGSKDEAEAIMRSVQEKALADDEMGMYWRKETGWYWYQAPVETQALIIEALDEISNNQKAVEQAKIWLLKQKQTTSWKTSQATVEAVYALLLTGKPLLAEDQQVKIKVGNEEINQNAEIQPAAGTGYFKKSWSGKEVTAQLGNIEISNPNNNITWGGAYWQYFENLDRITKSDSPLKIEKQLFVEVLTDNGPVLTALEENQNLKPGDKVVSRLIITTDRDLEYVQVTDMRATAFEPTEYISGYTYSGGLGYYKNITDVSTDFFIQYLNKGMYLLEYPMMVTQKGEFSNGIATIQCYYAPEFSAHSAGLRVVVK